MAIRAHVVSLLTGIADLGQFGRWTHRDGRPLTKAEVALLLSATAEELAAGIDYLDRATEQAEEQGQHWREMKALLSPYLADAPAGTTVRDVVPLLSDEERVEYDRLVELVAPDGTVVV